MLKIFQIHNLPGEWENQILTLFNSYHYKDFQISYLGIQKSFMSRYLLSTINKQGILYVMIENGRLISLAYFNSNKKASRILNISFWNLKHLIFAPGCSYGNKYKFTKYCLNSIKGKAGFIECRTAADNAEKLEILQKLNFLVIGGAVNCLIKTIDSPPEMDKTITIAKETFQNEEEILEIAQNNHKHNHFIYDKNFSEKDVNTLYFNSIQQSIKSENDNVLIAKDSNGVVLGFLTYKTSPRISQYVDKNIASLDFIAISEKSQRKGLGHLLNCYALYELNRMSIESVMVRTMVSNYKALAVLGKLNMKITSADIILHKWMR